MAQNVTAIRKGLASGLIPDSILKQIDDQEVLDRIAYAGELNQKANGVSGAARRDLIQQARAVMAAQPRAVTERAVRETVAKASALGNGHQADAVRRRANELLELHPPAPRRQPAPAARPAPVAKAAKAPKAGNGGKPSMVAVYDAKGTLYAVVDQADLTLVEPQAAPPSPSEAKPAPAAAPAPAAQTDVAKATRHSARPPRAEVKVDASGQMIGVTRNGVYTPVPPEVLAPPRERERVAKAAADRDLAAAAADPEFGRAVMTALPAARREVVARWKASRPGRR